MPKFHDNQPWTIFTNDVITVTPSSLPTPPTELNGLNVIPFILPSHVFPVLTKFVPSPHWMDDVNPPTPAPPDITPTTSQQQGAATPPGVSMSSTMAETSGASTSTVVVVDEFLSTGRTGRRNALGDILDEKTAFLSTADLPDQLSALSFGAGKCWAQKISSHKKD